MDSIEVVETIMEVEAVVTDVVVASMEIVGDFFFTILGVVGCIGTGLVITVGIIVGVGDVAEEQVYPAGQGGGSVTAGVGIEIGCTIEQERAFSNFFSSDFSRSSCAV